MWLDLGRDLVAPHLVQAEEPEQAEQKQEKRHDRGEDWNAMALA